MLRSVWDDAAPDLARLAGALGVASGRAEDILQDVYLTAWRKPPPAPDRAGLRRWLFRVLVNRCHLEHRRDTRWRGMLHGLARIWGACSHPDAAEAACRGEDQQLVRSALARLSPRFRSILVLRYFAEFDSKAIGKILDLPDSTVRSHLRAARQQLALELKRAGYRHDS